MVNINSSSLYVVFFDHDTYFTITITNCWGTENDQVSSKVFSFWDKVHSKPVVSHGFDRSHDGHVRILGQKPIADLIHANM